MCAKGTDPIAVAARASNTPYCGLRTAYSEAIGRAVYHAVVQRARMDERKRKNSVILASAG